MFCIRDNISSSADTLDAFSDSCKIKCYKYVDRISDRRPIIRNIEIEPVRPSLDTRFVLEISENMIPKMSDHISDDIG